MQHGRWVSYIYRYRENARCENAGFIKIQKVAACGGSQARIQIGLKLYKESSCNCDVYLLLHGKKIRKLTDFIINARVHEAIIKRVELPWDNIVDEGYSLDQYDGVLIFCSDGEILAGMWKNYEPDFRQVKGVCKGSSNDFQERDRDVLQQVAVTEAAEAADPALEMINTYPKLPLFIDSPFIQCVKIVPQDIGRLHMNNWKLGSNSFLNHGYHRYRYLMIGRVKLHEGERVVLGVPGVYTNKEKYVANMFGFCRFVPLKKTETMTGKFGYWIWEILRE